MKENKKGILAGIIAVLAAVAVCAFFKFRDYQE